MKIEISKEAKAIIQETLCSDKYPKIILRKSGCAGWTLVLIKEVPKAKDIIVESDGIKFYIDAQVLKYTNNVSIKTKSMLDREIIVINNSIKQKCRCGKSFSISNL
ncbi:MAG: hypothetical protein LBE97_01195 [Holosporales bacterium]|jgi:iron-sulfur cluster assembly accessory protein|nr:hypothetical protein [Holosporales bacterium]